MLAGSEGNPGMFASATGRVSYKSIQGGDEDVFTNATVVKALGTELASMWSATPDGLGATATGVTTIGACGDVDPICEALKFFGTSTLTANMNLELESDVPLTMSLTPDYAGIKLENDAAIGGVLSPKKIIELQMDSIQLKCTKKDITLVAWGHGEACDGEIPIAPYGIKAHLDFKNPLDISLALVDKDEAELQWPDDINYRRLGQLLG